MGKKGKGGKGGKGKGDKKDADKELNIYPDITIIHRPIREMVTVRVKGAVWQILDCVLYLPGSTTVANIASTIAHRHGSISGRVDFALSVGLPITHDIMSNPALLLCDLCNNLQLRASDELTIYYDFHKTSFWQGVSEECAVSRFNKNVYTPATEGRHPPEYSQRNTQQRIGSMRPTTAPAHRNHLTSGRPERITST